MAGLVETVCDLYEKDGQRANVSNPRPKVFPPPTNGEIRAFEKKIQRKLPSSYVEFLTVTNAMVGYKRSFTLVGVSGDHTDKALADIEKRRLFYVAEWEQKHGKATEAAIAAFEKDMDLSQKEEDAAHIFPGNKLIVGTDFLGSLFYFLDPGPKQDSESKIIWRDNQDRLIVYESFREMLEKNIKVLRKRQGIPA